MLCLYSCKHKVYHNNLFYITKEYAMNVISRGIVLGGSLGFLFGLVITDVQQAFGLGMISGFCAGITLYIISRKGKKD